MTPSMDWLQERLSKDEGIGERVDRLLDHYKAGQMTKAEFVNALQDALDAEEE